MAAEFVELCSDGDLKGVQAALQSGVDVNSTNGEGQTGLMMSLENKHTEVASLLLEQEGIDINISDYNNKTALHFAAMYDQNSDILATLLARTTSVVNQRDCDGATPLNKAVWCNAVRCVQLLISDERTDPNIKDDDDGGDSPLMCAVTQNYVACVELLLSDKRTDPNIKDGEGDSPLMSAVKDNCVGIVELLLADPRVDLMTRDNYERSEEEVSR